MIKIIGISSCKRKFVQISSIDLTYCRLVQMLDAVCYSMDMSNAGAGSHPDLAQVGEAELRWTHSVRVCFVVTRISVTSHKTAGESNLLRHTTLGHRGRKRPDIIITSIRASPALHNDNTA